MSAVPTTKPTDVPASSHSKTPQAPTSAAASSPPRASAPGPSDKNPILTKAEKLLEQGRPKDAFELLNAKSTLDPVLRTARGVCLLRMQQPNLAVRAFREIVLASGSIGLRWDVPLHYKTNLALALLLDNNVAGCTSVLNETGHTDDPRVRRLVEILENWKSSLSFWQRIMWNMGVAPDVPVKIDFIPGDLH